MYSLLRRCRRLLWSKKLLILLVGLLVIVLVYLLLLSDVMLYNPELNERKTECLVSVETQSQALDVAAKVTKLLTLHKILHFLCYESLWGALRQEKLLQWEDRVQICAMNEDLTQYDELFLVREFRKRGLLMKYDSKTGIFTVWAEEGGEKPSGGIVEINMFERLLEFKKVRRIGWKHRLLPPTSEHMDSFPTVLIEQPLASAKLGYLTLPAPRDGVEIQKYHYKESWWKESKPSGC